MTVALRLLAGVVAVVAVLAWPYIELELAADVRGWALDVPVADAAGAALVAIGAGLLLTGTRPIRPYGGAAWLLFLAVGVLGALGSDDAARSLHDLLRKPVFMWLAWGGALALVVARVGTAEGWRATAAVAACLCAVILFGSSVARIAAGDALWWAPIEGLTGNHKTLAVALAPALPLVWGPSRRARLLVAFLALALVASASRTSLLSAAVGLAMVVPVGGRPLSHRRGVLPALLVGGLAIAFYAPALSGSLVQLDALRSRHSLDVRAWEMFRAHPLVGMGAGAGVHYEIPTFPHYRVNGVDAHGVIQKLASEHGVLGLGAWLAGTATSASRVYARTTPHDPRLLATFVALHVNLLLSTETFSQTHWVPLALVWGLSLRRAE